MSGKNLGPLGDERIHDPVELREAALRRCRRPVAGREGAHLLVAKVHDVQLAEGSRSGAQEAMRVQERLGESLLQVVYAVGAPQTPEPASEHVQIDHRLDSEILEASEVPPYRDQTGCEAGKDVEAVRYFRNVSGTVIT